MSLSFIIVYVSFAQKIARSALIYFLLVSSRRLDEEYRNDLGFLYAARVEAPPPGSGGRARVRALELVPTKISHAWGGGAAGAPPYESSVGLARGADAEWLDAAARRLCGEMGTRVGAGKGGRLVIVLDAAEE